MRTVRIHVRPGADSPDHPYGIGIGSHLEIVRAGRKHGPIETVVQVRRLDESWELTLAEPSEVPSHLVRAA